MKISGLLGVGLLAAAMLPSGAFAASNVCSVSLAQDPVIMRLGKDEFRIAFGLSGEHCAQPGGCAGTINYRADWKAEDGTLRNEHKQLAFTIPDGAKRSLVVDRHYFDTSEGKHTTDVTLVSIENVSCDATVARATASR
jgi:hypothetical protein